MIQKIFTGLVLFISSSGFAQSVMKDDCLDLTSADFEKGVKVSWIISEKTHKSNSLKPFRILFDRLLMDTLASLKDVVLYNVLDINTFLRHQYKGSSFNRTNHNLLRFNTIGEFRSFQFLGLQSSNSTFDFKNQGSTVRPIFTSSETIDEVIVFQKIKTLKDSSFVRNMALLAIGRLSNKRTGIFAINLEDKSSENYLKLVKFLYNGSLYDFHSFLTSGAFTSSLLAYESKSLKEGFYFAEEISSKKEQLRFFSCWYHSRKPLQK